MTAILTTRRAVRAIEWTGWSFGLNLVWEIAQLPLYAFPRGTPMSSIAFAVAHCTLGDATVALVAYLVASAVTRSTAWPIERAITGLIVALCITVGWTIWAEWNAVYITRAWMYSPEMPVVGGIGLAPLLQSLLLPMIALAIVRTSTRRRKDRGARGVR